MEQRAKAVVLLIALYAVPAAALDYQWGEFTVNLNNRVGFGADWRMQDRDIRLLGKLNVPGQQHLCDADACLSFSGDPAPNQRLVDAKGAFLGHISDDGDLGYNKHDIVAANSKITTAVTVGWRNFVLKARGIAFYDEVNDGRDDFHTNTNYQPAETPRSGRVNREVGKSVDLLDAVAIANFKLGDRNVTVSAGNQILRWGESNFIALNSISEVNPPDQNRLQTPGGQISEVFQPVPLVTVSADVIQNLSVEGFYQLRWRPVRPAAPGSFFSMNDVLGGSHRGTSITMSQVAEDPDGKFRLPGTGGLISDSSTTAAVLPNGYGTPKNSGQYGFKLNYFAEAINNGTEFGLYAMNYHSRLPYISVIAAQESCARNSTNFVQAAVDCNGFNGSARQQIGTALGINTLLPPKEPLPLDTIKLFADYPENVHLFGVSFNTNVGAWSLAGEYSYRPNLPAQVDLSDVLYAAAAPAVPRQDIPIGIPNVLVIATIPGVNNIFPSYLTRYRNIDVAGGQTIRGYERLKVGQLDLTAIKTISAGNNPIHADQIVFLAEAGMTQVYNMPGRDRLQFEGGLFQKDTHASPGADGTGSGGVPDSRRFNPTQQTSGFADDFAWGYRLVLRAEYNDLIGGINAMPLLLFGQDVRGIGIFPMQNFVEGRTQYVIGSEFDLGKGWSSQIAYQIFAGKNDILHDRDNLLASVAYNF